MGSWDLGVLGYHDGIFISRNNKRFFKKKNEFLTRKPAIRCKHTAFFPDLPDPSAYLWNRSGKVPFFLGKEKKMLLFLLRPFIPKKNQEADHMYSKPTD